MRNPFDLERLHRHPMVGQIEFEPAMDSTNSRAISMLRSGAARMLPLIVLTELQVAGRGQHDRVWMAEPGSLTFSLALPIQSSGQAVAAAHSHQPSKIRVEIDDTLLPLAAALAVCKTIEPTGLKLQIKWPNDILISGRKLAGILTESVVTPKGPMAVIGIGINANANISLKRPKEAVPNELTDGADMKPVPAAPTSLAEQLGDEVDLTALLVGIVETLEMILKSTAGEIATGIQRRLIFLDRRIALQTASETIEGRCKGINQQGFLIIESNGQTRLFASGQIVRFDSGIGHGPGDQPT